MLYMNNNIENREYLLLLFVEQFHGKINNIDKATIRINRVSHIYNSLCLFQYFSNKHDYNITQNIMN